MRTLLDPSAKTGAMHFHPSTKSFASTRHGLPYHTFGRFRHVECHDATATVAAPPVATPT